jgi:RNA polymerase sigma-70 factor, ECF subfamily
VAQSPYLKLVSADAPKRDEPAAVAAFREHVRFAHAIAFRILGRQAEVDDLLQDLFIAARKDLRDTSEPAAVRKWFAVATVRMARRRARRGSLLRFFGFDEPGFDAMVAPGATPEQQAEVSALYGLLQHVPLQSRIAWTLRNLDGLPLADVAEACGCSLATAKRRIAAAHELIEEAWRD